MKYFINPDGTITFDLSEAQEYDNSDYTDN